MRNDTAGFQEQGTVTDGKGEYSFRSLPPGEGYRLTVSLAGYSTIVLTDIALRAERTEEQNVVLRPESETRETVRVQAKSETLDTEKVTASTTFTSSFIADLPILGRDYQEVLVLAPGVTDVNKTGNPNIHGARDTDVITLVDGVSTTDPFTGYFGQNLNIESIQELEVITSAATAQYSRAQGGFASILTKSGGNEFQGTFKFFARSDRLDGDGAGVEKADVTGGLLGNKAYTAQHFTDLLPFLSVSGAIVRDKLWYYVASELIHIETPVNAVTQAYVTPVYGSRTFAKTTWQIHPAHRLAFSLILDNERRENLGIDSLTDVDSGYSTTRGGPTLTLKESAIFKPTVLLESTVAWFDNSFTQTPTMNPDTNGNGILFVDNNPMLGGNGDGRLDASERDMGEDWDADGYYDVFEDLNHNGLQNYGEDLDHDGSVSAYHPSCDGYHHEDRNCNGYLDAEEDSNLNGRLDPQEDTGIACDPKWGYCPDGTLPGTKGNGRLDTEDVNGNGVLDVVGNSGYTSTPFWTDTNGNGWPDKGEYRAPLPPDQELVRDASGRTFGPYPYQYQDHRTRWTWAEDLSLYIGEMGGTHDLKLGGVYEHEGYDSDTFRRPTISYPYLSGVVGIPAYVNNAVTGDNLGLYFQDTWKPIPNLTLGLGLRYDFESLESFGWSHFNPAAERKAYNALMSVAGSDVDNYDGISVAGFCLDPIHSCVGSADLPLQALTSQLRNTAYGRMTRHNLEVEILSAQLVGSLGGASDLGSVLGYAVHTRHQEKFNISNANLAPRLSLSWDPWADGKTMVFGSWGRYYDKLFLNTMTLEQGPDTVNRSYAASPSGLDDQGLPDNRIGPPRRQSALSAFQVDRNLATPYSVEWTAGFRRELAPEVMVSARYIHRDYHDQLQDIDINHHTQIDSATGKLSDHFGGACPTDGVGAAQCVPIPNGAPDLYIENFYFNRVYWLSNLNEQTYRGWEVEFVRRLRRKWEMQASYTYSVTQGDAETYLSELGNDPSLVEYEPGYLDYDQRHVVKFNAVANLPRDWRLGGTITWSSGLPFSGIVHYSDLDDGGYVQNRILFGQLGIDGNGITTQHRNIHRNEAGYLFNGRVTKNFVIGKASASAFFEAYNLLNSDTLRIHVIDQIPAQDNGKIRRPAQTKIIGEQDFGRRFQIGFQLNF